MIEMRTLSLALATLIGCLSIPRAAHACTAPACTRTLVFPAGGNIPADRLRILYAPSSSLGLDVDRAISTLPRIYRLEGSTKVSVPYDTTVEGAHGVWLTPTIEQPLGTQLVLESDAGRDAPLSVTYSITEKRPLPTTLGTLAATMSRAQLPIADGTYSGLADVSYADVRVDLSDEARPFAALWRYQLYVDGELHGSSSDGASSSRARVYTQCGGHDVRAGALTSGVHRVHFAAQLADEAPLVTPDVELALSCEGEAPSSQSAAATIEPAAATSCALTTRGDASWFALALLALLRRPRRV